MLKISNSKGEIISFSDNSIIHISADNIESAFSATFIKKLILEKNQDCFSSLTASITNS